MKYYIKTLSSQKKIMDTLAIFAAFVLFGLHSSSCCRDKKNKPDESDVSDITDKNAPLATSSKPNVVDVIDRNTHPTTSSESNAADVIDENAPVTTSSSSSSCASSNNQLNRFHVAQTSAILADVDRELRNGKKETHWIWFIFPQIDGLSDSPSLNSKLYSIKSLDEACKYLKDEFLRGNLMKHTQLVRNHKNKKLIDIFGYTDKQKFISSMTLFYLASDDPFFSDTLKVFSESLDAETINLAKKTINRLCLKVKLWSRTYAL
jgi:uncharacterized protein (DUF1810 family)